MAIYPVVDLNVFKPGDSVPSFRFGQVGSVGGLEIRVFCPGGTPLSPFSISFALYEIGADQVPTLRGLAERACCEVDVGHYYAPFTAGEFGQPGHWMIRWSWHVTWDSDVESREAYFDVVDCVSSPIAGDPLVRVNKHGWE